MKPEPKPTAKPNPTTLRMTEDMEQDAEAIRDYLEGQGISSSLTDIVRMTMRQFRLRIKEGDLTFAPASPAENPVPSKARKPKAK